MNSEKIAELVNMEQAAKEIENIKDLSLNQFLNNGIYVAFNKYSEAIKENTLSSDFDLHFFIEILKGMFSNKTLLKGIIEGEDYRWFDDEEKENKIQHTNVEELKKNEKTPSSPSIEKATKHFKLFLDYFIDNNLGLAKKELKKALTLDKTFLVYANNTLLESLELAGTPQQFNIWEKAFDIFRFISLEYPDHELARSNLASLFLNYGGIVGEKGNIEESIRLQRLACNVFPSEQVENIARHNLAVCYTRLGQMANINGNLLAALEFMLDACTYKPNESTKYNVGVAAFYLAEDMLKNKNFLPAIENFLLALDSGLRLPQVLNDLGVAYASLNELDNAILYFEKALELDPNTEIARKNLEKAEADSQKMEDLEMSHFALPGFQQMNFQEYQAA
ncbi:MAG: tetratricopeptide repeat protein [Acidobacteria bacterium]|nr:tetratricopeptide repeat protein [Acidobacteriota bacterium]